MSRMPQVQRCLALRRAAVEVAAMAPIASHRPKTLQRIGFMSLPRNGPHWLAAYLLSRNHAASAAQRQAAAKPCQFAVFREAEWGLMRHDVMLSSAIMI